MKKTIFLNILFISFFHYLSNSLECDYTCKTCKGISENDCTTCNKDRYLSPTEENYIGKCLINCPEGFSQQNKIFVPDSTNSILLITHIATTFLNNNYLLFENSQLEKLSFPITNKLKKNIFSIFLEKI